jgi:NAD+ synthase (glutamine-hydrolysing)
MLHRKYAKLAVCQMNQWAMSFSHNRDNIIKSIRMAKAKGASYRLGPELEVCGYSCEDHFLEPDTVTHSWQVLAEILQDKELTQDILCDIGMPVSLNGVLYNCRVYCLNQEALLVRPKLHMADNGNYREGRWFKPWVLDGGYGLVDFQLPACIQEIKG